ncbi:hypothetical protein [Streptomyces sp. NPDC127092]|uniref:hypothetical protein n=1 Tax=Streptomyces sp. NPDC127092 TaxID=3347135 RepID=UPI0036649C90
MTVRAAWLQSTGQTREDTRLTLAALLTPSGQSADETPLRSRPGILPGGFLLTSASPMQCTIGTGRAIVQGKDTSQGAYLVAVTAPETLTVEDGNAQYDRIDLIELVVLDDQYDKTGVTEAKIRLVKGTPAAVPAAPVSPDGSTLPLYTVTVKKGTSAGTGGIVWTGAGTNVTAQHWPVVALGGILPTSGFKGAYAGQYRDAGSVLQRWDGATWVSYPKAIGGIAPSGTTSGGYAGQYRDSSTGLQRWDGSAWQYTEGAAKILFGATQYLSTQQQSVPSNTWTAISLPTVEMDDAAGWNSTNNTYVIPRTGYWRLGGHVTWANDSQTGMRGARILVGGTNQPRLTWLISAGNGAISVGGQGLMKLTAGATVQLQGYQSHTAAVKTLGGSGYGCTLHAEWVKA